MVVLEFALAGLTIILPAEKALALLAPPFHPCIDLPKVIIDSTRTKASASHTVFNIKACGLMVLISIWCVVFGDNILLFFKLFLYAALFLSVVAFLFIVRVLIAHHGYDLVSQWQCKILGRHVTYASGLDSLCSTITTYTPMV